MKKGTFILFFCIGVFTGSYAQTKQESIRELFHLRSDDSATTKMMKSMMPMFAPKTSQEMDSTTRAKYQEKMKAMKASITKIIAKVTEDRLKLYDQYFTQEEIKGMIVFYKSPVGRKYAHVKPEIIGEIVMKVMKEYMPEIEKQKKAMQEDQKEEEKK